MYGCSENYNSQAAEMHLAILMKKLNNVVNNKDIYKIIMRHYELTDFVGRCGEEHLTDEDKEHLRLIKEAKRDKSAACDMGFRTPLAVMALHHNDLHYTATCAGKNAPRVFRRRHYNLLTLTRNEPSQVCAAYP